MSGAEEIHRFVVGSAMMIVAIFAVELLVAQLFSSKSMRFKNNVVSLAANIVLILPVRFPALFPWVISSQAAIMMGFECYELACIVFNLRAIPQGGGGRMAQYMHHGTCVLMGIVSIIYYGSLPDDERLVWSALWFRMIGITSTSVFLSARVLFPGFLSDIVFAISFIYIRLIENPTQYFRFTSDYGSFTKLALPTSIILVCWTLLSVLNFYWGYLLVLKMSSKIFGQRKGKKNSTQTD